MIKEPILKQTLLSGVAYMHDGMSDSEKEFVKKLFREGAIRLLVAIYTMSWNLDDLESHIVVILDAERYDGHEHRAVEYAIPDVL